MLSGTVGDPSWRRHDEEVARQFRFRVREGHQVHTFVSDWVKTEGAGYEFVLPEEDAARVLRDPRNRDKYDLVEIIAEDEAATPRAEPPSRE